MDEQPINLLKPQSYPFSSPPPKNKTKWVVFLVLGVAILGLLIFRNYTIAKWPSNPTAYDSITLKPKRVGFLQTVKNFIFNSNNVIAGQQEDRINILLLGIGGSGHEGPYLSDTNIILSIKPSTNEVAMVSVPRDLAVKINGHGIRKINNADAFGEAEQADGGGEYARKIFEQTFSLSIPYYTRVDFTAFKELIDAMGGININIARPFVDTAYPGPDNSFQTVSFDAGMQQLNGERALIFTRSRHGSNGEGSDFARAKRQQLVLAAFKKKLLSASTYLNPMTLQKIMTSLSRHIITNMDFGQIMYLVGMAKEMNDENVKTLVLDDSPNGFLRPISSVDSAYLLGPKTGDYSEINSAINNIFSATNTIPIYTPDQNRPVPVSASIPTAYIEIQNGTWHAGLATIKKQELEKIGLLISSVGNSVKRPIATTTIYIINPNTPSAIIIALTAKLHASSTTSLPEWLQIAYNASSSSSDIIIVLGEDAKQ
ncbi:MAG: LCP family protein [Patescibacteria group bacterium]